MHVMILQGKTILFGFIFHLISSFSGRISMSRDHEILWGGPLTLYSHDRSHSFSLAQMQRVNGRCLCQADKVFVDPDLLCKDSSKFDACLWRPKQHAVCMQHIFVSYGYEI